MKTTATPWRLDATASGGNIVIDSLGYVIAECPKYGAGIMPEGHTAPWHMSRGNAALIVESVNGRAERAALLECRRQLEALATQLEFTPGFVVPPGVTKALAGYEQARKVVQS